MARLGGHPLFVFDVKRRHIKSTDFKTVFESREKYDCAVEMMRDFGMPMFLIIKWDDCIKIFDASEPDVNEPDDFVFRRDLDTNRPVVGFDISRGIYLN